MRRSLACQSNGYPFGNRLSWKGNTVNLAAANSGQVMRKLTYFAAEFEAKQVWLSATQSAFLAASLRTVSQPPIPVESGRKIPLIHLVILSPHYSLVQKLSGTWEL
jgi:hypothetical protein